MTLCLRPHVHHKYGDNTPRVLLFELHLISVVFRRRLPGLQSLLLRIYVTLIQENLAKPLIPRRNLQGPTD